MKRPTATIGFKSKTGRAIAVALSGSASSPEFVVRREVPLSDEQISATMQPYHEVMELPWNEAIVAVQPTIEAIEKIATESVAALIQDIATLGFDVPAVAIVGPEDRKLERIGNPHIRAHAAEGVLFRHVLEVAAKANHLPSRCFTDPAAELKRPSREINKVLTSLGRGAGPPWRSEEKAAALASWLILSRHRSPRP